MRTHRRHAFPAWLVLLGCVASAPLSADFKGDYVAGLRNFDNGDFVAAANAFEDAIRQEPQAKAKVRIYGMRYAPYLPHFNLGRALYRAGNCAGAMRAWTEALNQAVINEPPMSANLAELEKGRADCQSAFSNVGDVARQAATAVDTLDEKIAAFRALQQQTELAAEWEANWKPEADAAIFNADLLRQSLEAAIESQDGESLNTLLGDARAAIGDVEAKHVLAEARLGALRSRQQQATVDQRQQAATALEQALRSGQDMGFIPGSNDMLAMQQQLLDFLERGATALETPDIPVQTLRNLAVEINNLSRRYATARQEWEAEQLSTSPEGQGFDAPPESLQRIADAYFTGDFERVGQLVNPQKADSPRMRVQALLFRAAANYNLYLLSNREQLELLDQTREDIRAIKAIDSSFTPYIAAFSPRFLEFFAKAN